MTSKSLQERILRTCYEFMNAEPDRYQQKQNQAFYTEFKTFVKEKTFENLLRRGSDQNIADQWKQSSGYKARELHKILQGDELQKISVNGLIDEMKKLDSTTTYDFETSSYDILTVQDTVEDFVLSEAKRQLQRVMHESRFFQSKPAILRAFLPSNEKQKGLLTRIMENDPSLSQIKYENLVENRQEEIYYTQLRRSLYASGQLISEQSEHQQLLVQNLVELMNHRDSNSKFLLTEHGLKIQKIVQEVRSRLLKYRANMKERQNHVEAELALSFVSLQLKDVLSACHSLLTMNNECSDQGKRAELDNVMRTIMNNVPDKEGIFEPSFCNEIIEKVQVRRDFSDSAELISAITGTDYESSYTAKSKTLQDSWPTALENLFALVYFLRRQAMFIKRNESDSDINILFQRAFVIDQSEATYKMLFELLRQTKALMMAKIDTREKELVTFLFDGFCEITLNNLQALYESERTHLKIVFAKGKSPNYDQEEFYPQMLSMLLWRQKSRESSAFKDLIEWQKVLQFEKFEAMKLIYTETGLENEADLCKQHQKFMPHLINYDEELPKLIMALDTECTDDNSDSFNMVVEGAQDFIKHAIDQQNPAVSTLIREVFKRKMVTNADQNKEHYCEKNHLLKIHHGFPYPGYDGINCNVCKKNCLGKILDAGFMRCAECNYDACRSCIPQKDNVCDILAEQLKSQLFVASDNQQSKISNVVADICSQEVHITQNAFTTSVLRMLTADSVNMLKNVQEVNLEKKEKKSKLPWKKVIQKTNLHGQSGGETHHKDGQKVVDDFDENQLPEIREFGIYTTSYVAGIKIVYRNGTIVDQRGSGDFQEYQSLTMEKGEYISIVNGRFGGWGDQISIQTNLGRSLIGGGNGGTEVKPAYPVRSYFIGMDTHWHHSLCRTEVYYINLDEVPFIVQDPLITLISESDLLSKGLEPKHMGVFSEKVLQEIKTVQGIIGKPIIDENIKSIAAASASESSSAATSMINTTGLSNASLAIPEMNENDLHMQIIHAGNNEILDDFIQVLQLLLKESREPVRAQMNIMQENGMKMTRACFAVIVKISGLTNKLEYVLQNLELQEMDFEADEPAERLNLMKDAAKELAQDTPLLLSEWCNAVKMRKWLKDECLSEKIDLENQSDHARFETLLSKVIKKAEFLTKLEKSPVFHSMSPKEEIFELSYKIPSYVRDDIKDKDEIHETPDNEPKLWREHYKTWKANLKQSGTIGSQNKHSKIRQIGTASIIVCLQHKEITQEVLIKIVETNTLNSCYRLAGLQLLEFIISIINRCSQDEKPSKMTMMAIRNVAAALNKGIRQEKSILQQNETSSYHYLDGIKSCGTNLESLIRQSFFNVVSGISDYFAHADKNFLLELLSCLDWSFKARDFENLLDLKVFKLLHTGVSKKVEAEEGKVEKQNIVLESQQLRPFEPLTKELQVISSNLYMGIVSRLAEPEARKIIFNKVEEKATGVGSLSRATSVVNVNAAQALLADQFNIMFREFHEFVLVASKLSRYIDFDTISDFYASGESQEYINAEMPRFINETMTKIIQNAPYVDLDQSIEESKKVPSAAPEEVKFELPTEKPWLKKSKTKVYDSSRYTQDQIEVLEQIDSGTSLTQRQNTINQQMQAAEEASELCGMFDEELEEDEPVKQISHEIFVKKLAKDDQNVPRLRQKFIQGFRQFKEETNVARYLNMVQIFVKVATKAPYPLEMLQNVANPYHIKTLIKMLFQVSAGCKIQILTIFQTLLRIQVPLSIFDEGVQDLEIRFRTECFVEFQSSFALLLFQAALQIQSKTWDSIFSEGHRSGMHDVCVNLTRTVALCLKIQGQAPNQTPYCEELSQAYISMSKSELSEQQVTIVMQVMQATCTMPVCGDHVLFSKDSDNSDQPETSELVSWGERANVFKDIKYSKGCHIVPSFVPDQEILLTLSPEALEGLVTYLNSSYGELKAGNIQSTLQILYTIKLLILQHSENGEKGLQKIQGELRKSLIRILGAIVTFKSEDEKEDEGIYITSLLEVGLAIQLRDQYETILPSGVDPFNNTPSLNVNKQESLTNLRPRKSTNKKTKNSASGKYAEQVVLNRAKTLKQSKGAPISNQQKLVNSMFSEILATDTELIEMVDAMVDLCKFSGCSLLELLYAVNESISDEKRFFTTESIVEMFNEQLEKLTLIDDVEQDIANEKQFVELVVKKLEKVVSVYKPNTFKTEVIPKLNFEQAIEEVEIKTLGKSNLMRARTEDRLFNKTEVYTDFAQKMKQLLTVETFQTSFNNDLKESKQSSQWPFSAWPVTEFPLRDDKNILKCTVVLAKRFAEKLLFKIFDPTMDTREDDQERDIADVMAGAPSFSIKTCYNQVYGSVDQGLRSYAKSSAIMTKSSGVECSWEARFTENFKIESNLTSDFNSLRELDDYAFTQNMLVTQSAGSMAKQAQEMLNQKILQQGSPEDQAQSAKFLVYLLKCVITQIIDDFAYKVDSNNTRYSSSMVSAISKQKPYYASSSELVERVRLMTCSVMSSNSVQLIAMFAPDLLNLTLFTVLHQKTGLHEKRLLLDEAFQIVDAFDSDNLKSYVEMGCWEKITQCCVLKRILDTISKENFSGDDINGQAKQQSLISILMFELQSKISRIHKRAQNIPGMKRISEIELHNDTKPAFNLFQKEVTQKISSVDIQTSLLNDFLESEVFDDKFKKEYEVPAIAEPIVLDLNYQDGAIVSFKIEPQAGDDLQKLSQTQFEVKYSMVDSKEDQKSFKLFTDSNLEAERIESRYIRIICSASNQKTNVAAINHDQKFRRSYGMIEYILTSTDKKSTFFVTDKAIYQEGEYGTKEITPRNDLFSLSENKITQITNFGENYIFTTEQGAKFATHEQGILLIKIGEEKIMKEIIKEQIRAYITENGKLHYQNLFDCLSLEEAKSDIEELKILDTSNRLDNFREGDAIVDLSIGGKDSNKYAILTVNRNGKKLLFSKGFSKVILQNKGHQEGDEEKFYLLANQTSRSSFQKVFLFDTVAFAVDKNSNLWVLGGKMALQDDDIFPKDLLGSDMFEAPTKTKLYESVKSLLSLEDSIKVQVKDISYSEKLILLTIETLQADGSSEEVRISLVDGGEGKYKLNKISEKNAFILEDNLWQVVEPGNAANEEDAEPSLGVLKMVVKPLVRNVNNISMEMLATALVSESEELQGKLRQLEKVGKNEDLIVKVYRAMNNWIRVKIENRLPNQVELKSMIVQATSEYNEEGYNPLKCWNDIDTENDINMLVKVFVRINTEINLREDNMLKSVRRQVLNDPLLQQSLLNERLNQVSDAPSLDLSLKFCHSNQFLLSRIQDQLFESDPKEPQCGESRIEVDFYRFKASQVGIEGKVDRGDGDTLFTQLFVGMEKQQDQKYKAWWRREGNDNRVFRANFKGESSIDAGGPYRELMENISRELCSSVLPILIPTENQRHEHGNMRECFVLNHEANTKPELKQVHHFGLIIGFAIRSMQSWNMALHPSIWKVIVGAPLDATEDLKTSDKFMHQMFDNMREQAVSSQSEEEFSTNIENQCFTIDIGRGETEIIPGGTTITVTRGNLEQYIKMASLSILQKAFVQMQHFLSGVYFVVPKTACQSLSWRNAEVRAMGEPIIDMNILKKYTTNEHSLPKNTMEWFWEVLNEMEEDDKQKYLKFVNGRAKLPSNPADGRKHKITNGRGGDGALPQSHTCFFQIDLPAYTSKDILREKLLIAIRLCGEIDTD